MSPCFYGVDTPSKKELIAANHPIDEIRRFVQADSLGYLSLDVVERVRDGSRRTSSATRATRVSIQRRMSLMQLEDLLVAEAIRASMLAQSALQVQPSRIRKIAEVAMTMAGRHSAVLRRIQYPDSGIHQGRCRTRLCRTATHITRRMPGLPRYAMLWRAITGRLHGVELDATEPDRDYRFGCAGAECRDSLFAGSRR